MRILTAAAAALLGLAIIGAPASAQYHSSSLATSATEMYRACHAFAKRQPTIATPEQACACMAGYMGGALSDRDYDIASRLARVGLMIENGAPQEQVNAEVAAFYAAGYTTQDSERVSALMGQIADRGDAVCGPFQGEQPVS